MLITCVFYVYITWPRWNWVKMVMSCCIYNACHKSIYGFWLPLWYLQTFLKWDFIHIQLISQDSFRGRTVFSFVCQNLFFTRKKVDIFKWNISECSSNLIRMSSFNLAKLLSFFFASFRSIYFSYKIRRQEKLTKTHIPCLNIKMVDP